MDGICKMFMQEDNGGFGILVTDGMGFWYYWGENDLPVNLTENAATNVRIIREAIESGEMYNARDFIDETLDIDTHRKHIIVRYTKCESIDEVSEIENRDRYFDKTEYYYIEGK